MTTSSKKDLPRPQFTSAQNETGTGEIISTSDALVRELRLGETILKDQSTREPALRK